MIIYNYSGHMDRLTLFYSPTPSRSLFTLMHLHLFGSQSDICKQNSLASQCLPFPLAQEIKTPTLFPLTSVISHTGFISTTPESFSGHKVKHSPLSEILHNLVMTCTVLCPGTGDPGSLIAPQYKSYKSTVFVWD